MLARLVKSVCLTVSDGLILKTGGRAGLPSGSRHRSRGYYLSRNQGLRKTRARLAGAMWAGSEVIGAGSETGWARGGRGHCWCRGLGLQMVGDGDGAGLDQDVLGSRGGFGCARSWGGRRRSIQHGSTFIWLNGQAYDPKGPVPSPRPNVPVSALRNGQAAHASGASRGTSVFECAGATHCALQVESWHFVCLLWAKKSN